MEGDTEPAESAPDAKIGYIGASDDVQHDTHSSEKHHGGPQAGDDGIVTAKLVIVVEGGGDAGNRGDIAEYCDNKSDFLSHLFRFQVFRLKSGRQKKAGRQ